MTIKFYNINVKIFRNTMLKWYEKNGRKFPWRKKSATKYQLVIAEILLQRTKAETVSRFFPDFIKRFPSWKDIEIATEKDMRCYLKPIGLWRRRAASLRLLAIEMVKRKGRFPNTQEELESLPGVGQYIANAIMLFCHGKPRPFLDVNMARVLERCFGPRKLADIRYDPHLQEISVKVVSGNNAAEINWAILDFATKICKSRKPDTKQCPLAQYCGCLGR